MERACAGLSKADVDTTMAEVQANIEQVGPLRQGDGIKLPPHLAGAVIQVRATRTMTPQWLGRVLQCQVAQQEAALSRAQDGCPLDLGGVQSEVTPTQTGFAVTIQSRNADVAGEIVRRVNAFAAVECTTARAE
jgi:hypothetical protein